MYEVQDYARFYMFTGLETYPYWIEGVLHNP